jgi:hypothetical protein
MDAHSCDENVMDFMNVVRQSALLPFGSVSYPSNHTRQIFLCLILCLVSLIMGS